MTGRVEANSVKVPLPRKSNQDDKCKKAPRVICISRLNDSRAGRKALSMSGTWPDNAPLLAQAWARIASLALSSKHLKLLPEYAFLDPYASILPF